MEPADRNPGRYAEKGYVDSYGYQSLCETFLRACNPFLYGEGEAKASVEQLEKLKLAVMGLQALSRALQESGKLDDKSDPVMMSMVDPRNVWAYSGKMHRPVVAIHLPLANKTIMMKQFWMQDQDFSEGGLIDGHTTVSRTALLLFSVSRHLQLF